MKALSGTTSLNPACLETNMNCDSTGTVRHIQRSGKKRKSHQTYSYIIIRLQTLNAQHTLDGNPVNDNVHRGRSLESDEK